LLFYPSKKLRSENYCRFSPNMGVVFGRKQEKLGGCCIRGKTVVFRSTNK
jgi:hypothetical protein